MTARQRLLLTSELWRLVIRKEIWSEWIMTSGTTRTGFWKV